MIFTYRIQRTGPIAGGANGLEGLTRERVNGAIHSMGFALEQLAKENAPSGVTGAYRNSIKTVPGDLTATVTSDSPYAPFVETGTRPHFPWDMSASNPFAATDAANYAAGKRRRTIGPRVPGWYPDSFVLWVRRRLGIDDPKELKSALFLVARKMKQRGTSIAAASKPQFGDSPGAGGYWPFTGAVAKFPQISQHFLGNLGVQLTQDMGGAK